MLSDEIDEEKRGTKYLERDEKKPACSVVEQTGVPRDRVIGGLIDRKGLFYLLTLERIYLLPTENVDLTVYNSLDILYIALYVLNACGF